MTKAQTQQHSPSPFFDLLAEAEEVQIRELESASQDNSIRSTLSKPADDSGVVRSFVVHIKNSPEAQRSLPSTTVQYEQGYLLQSAELLVENGDYVLARNIFSYLLNINLRDQKALRGLGICLFHLSDRISARKCFKAWFELYQSAEAQVWMGRSYAADSDWTTALTAFSQITDRSSLADGVRFEMYRSIGTCHARLGHLGPAEEAYRAALQIQPASDPLWVNLGSLELQRGRTEAAETSFRQALEHNPKCSKAYCGLGLGAMSTRNLSLAASYFRKALELDPENWLALEQWGQIFSTGMDFAQLQGHLLNFLRSQPRHADALALAGDFFEKNGFRDEASRYVTQALELDASHVRALLVKGRLNATLD